MPCKHAHCLELGVIDGVVPEPPDGAHADHDGAAELLQASVLAAFGELERVSTDDLLKERRAKFRAMGVLAQSGAL